MEKLQAIPTLEEIKTAHQSIRPSIHHTPVMTCNGIDNLTQANIFFKCENLQKVGAFKMRGASCAVAALSDAEIHGGIATHSSGNHAQAVALAAKMRGIPAHIVMPDNAPPVKVAAVAGYGATIYTSGPRIEEREELMQEVLQETGAYFIHPYDNYNIIAGQATASLELLNDIGSADMIMAPVGGGGLLSGTALTVKYMDSEVLVLGAEPARVNDAYRSFHSGKVEENTRIDTIADGLRTQLCHKTLKIIRTYVDDILLVTEESIVRAMRILWERMKLVVEPSGAVPLAAVLEHPSQFYGKKIGIIISGGNVDLDNLPF